MRSIATLGLGLVPALLLGGCVVPGLACTLIGCQSVLTVTLDTALEDVGSYTVTLSGDASATCTFIVSDGGVDRGDCGDVISLDPNFEQAANDPVEVLHLNVPEGDYSLTIELGDATLVDEALDADWGEPFQPNGPGCEPICHQGTAQAAVVLPGD